MCAHSFCRKCVKTNLAKGSECPVVECGETFLERELTKFFRSQFDGITVTCEEDDCGQVYSFNQTLAHRRKCCIKKTPCTNGCGKLLKGLDAHIAHVSDECEKARVICIRCKAKGALDVFDKHDCVQGFIN